MEKLAQFTEFETKYRTEIGLLIPFKRLVEAQEGHEFRYVQGPDHYFTKPLSPFLRLRVAQYAPLDGKRFIQLTSKSKAESAKNNVQRREPNLSLSGNNMEEIYNFIDMMGYKFNFRIWKSCHIYNFQDATVVFYTVIEDGTNKEAHFIEIEVTEETIHHLTEQQAWEVIAKYERLLAPVGVSPQKRLRNSLYDMYHKEVV